MCSNFFERALHFYDIIFFLSNKDWRQKMQAQRAQVETGFYGSYDGLLAITPQITQDYSIFTKIVWVVWQPINSCPVDLKFASRNLLDLLASMWCPRRILPYPAVNLYKMMEVTLVRNLVCPFSLFLPYLIAWSAVTGQLINHFVQTDFSETNQLAQKSSFD